MSSSTGVYRVLHWTQSSERVNLAVFIFGDEIPFQFKTLNDWSRASRFADWDVELMRDAVLHMLEEISAWGPVSKVQRWRHEMSILQLSEPNGFHVSNRDDDEILDGLVTCFLNEPKP